MQYGSVIVAAGASSCAGESKPMINLGSISMAQRIVSTLRQAGVSKIVVITGHNALAVERHLAKNNLVFLRNEDYENSHMFDSAKIGFEYLQDKCDRIFFTPVDIPLFKANTVTALMESGAELAYPVCSGQSGHPIMLSSALAGEILAGSGEGGLDGVLERCGVKAEEIPVDDLGVLMDADNEDDIDSLLESHNRQMVRPVVNVRISKEKVFLDEQIAMLLRLVDETSSVRTACQQMQMSYSRGWGIIKTIESQLSNDVLIRSQGGAGGGRSVLTDYGRNLLMRYDSFSQELREAAEALFEENFSDIFRG